MTATKSTEREEALTQLREWLKPGDTVYTILRHRSKSGMQREIGVVILDNKDGKTRDLHPNWLVSKALGIRIGKHEGLVIGGCGMDMGFSLVYELSHALWPKGDGKTVTGRNGDKSPETDGGYLLQQRWL